MFNWSDKRYVAVAYEVCQDINKQDARKDKNKVLDFVYEPY